MLTARSRMCGVCNHLLPEIDETAEDPRPRCTSCGHLACPHHSLWPMWLKWWVLVEAARACFLPHLHEQTVWERLLANTLNGSRFGAQANPNGFSTNTPAVDLYPEALKRASAWKKAGSSIARALWPGKDTRSSHAA